MRKLVYASLGLLLGVLMIISTWQSIVVSNKKQKAIAAVESREGKRIYPSDIVLQTDGFASVTYRRSIDEESPSTAIVSLTSDRVVQQSNPQTPAKTQHIAQQK